MRSTVGVLAVSALMLIAPAAFAVSYASGIQQSGSTVIFQLNQPGNVTVELDGGAGSLALGDLDAGTHYFDMTGYSDFCIDVTSSAGAGWTQIGGDVLNTSFYSPRGVSINKNPWSSNFGRIYVSNATAGQTAAFGRDTGDGIFTLDATLTDLGFATGGVDWTGGYGPWKSTVGPDDHLYVTDYNTDQLYEMSGDFSAATLLVGPDQKFDGQWVSSVYVEGTQAGGDRVVYTGNSHYADAHTGVIKYDMGGDAVPAGTGEQMIGPDAYAFYPYDIHKDANGDWYTVQYRWADGQTELLKKFDGSAPAPLGPNDIVWTSAEETGGGYAMDVNEEAGVIAVGLSAGETYSGVVWLFDAETGALLGELDPGMGYVRDLAYDAAGNLYMVDSTTEQLRIYSPGGAWTATTCSDGSFMVVPEPAALALLTLGLALVRRR